MAENREHIKNVFLCENDYKIESVQKKKKNPGAS